MTNDVIEHAGRIVRAEVRTSASPDDVWEAWTDRSKLSQWFTDKAEGAARVGETYSWTFERFGMTLPYRVIAVERPHRLVLGAADNPPGFVLEVRITPEGDQTVVEVVNSGLSEDPDWDEEYDGVRSGWRMALGVLKHYAEHYFGKARASFFAVRKARFEYAGLLPFYSDAYHLARWLTNEGGIGLEGEPALLVLRDGRTVSGPVLARTSREVVLAWEEIDGVLELKAFSLGRGARAVAVRGWGWGLSREEAQAIESFVEGAVERLVVELGP